MKSQETHLLAVLDEFGTALGLHSARDVETVRSRASVEGRGFFEIALPTLDDILLRGLADGQLPAIRGWAMKSRRPWPAFLHGYWQRVFNADGSLQSAPSIDAIRAIRQISRAYKKVFEVPEQDRIDAEVSNFLSTEEEVNSFTLEYDVSELTGVIHALFGGIVGRAISAEHQFRHGPGGVAEMLDSVERWDFPSVSADVLDLVGYGPFRPLYHGLSVDPPEIGSVPARLVAVPKTRSKPRLISIEPSYNQFVQQGLAAELRKLMSRIPAVNITDQGRNKDLARRGSIDGGLATVDLSEASDRLSWELVKAAFSFNPAFVRFLAASRSSTILVDGIPRELSKFAGMGSALTFPVQTMVFAALAVLAVARTQGRTGRHAFSAILRGGDVGVYGDDIILPTPSYPALVSLLNASGLKVNTKKSFASGLFRESCGGDYWCGHDVTPVYVRRGIPETRHDVEGLLSFSATRNIWVSKYGYGAVSTWYDELISSIVPYPSAPSGTVWWESGFNYSDALPTLRGIARCGPEDTDYDSRWNRDLQCMQYRVTVPSFKRKLVQASDRAVLTAALALVSGPDPFGPVPDRKRITHHGRPVGAKLTYRWVSGP